MECGMWFWDRYGVLGGEGCFGWDWFRESCDSVHARGVDPLGLASFVSFRSGDFCFLLFLDYHL